jgi:lipoprotein-releasing system ATP-binding protein
MLQRMVRQHGTAALVATHNPDLAAPLDRTVTLREGRVAEVYPLE